MNAQPESNTRLRGKWLFIARLTWAVVLMTLTAIYAFGFQTVHETLSTICEDEQCSLRVQLRRTDAGEQIVRSAGPPVGFADRLRPNQIQALETLGITLDQYAWLGALQLGLPALLLLLIAAGLFWWRSDDWMALFASVMVATFPLHNMPLAFTLTAYEPAWEWIVNSVTVVALSCLLIFPLLFPNGQFVPRWTRWMAIYDVICAVIASFLGYSILDVFGEDVGRVFLGASVVFPFAIGVYAQLHRYFRAARSAERQQFKWVVVGLVGTLVTQFAVLIPLNALLTSPAFSVDPARALVLSAIPDTLWQLNNLLIAVCIVISVLRYRLWDVDILINHTLVYFTLIAIITGLYVLVVGSLSDLLQNQNDLAAPLIAFLIIAAFVGPLRRVLQNYVNRFLRFDPARRDEAQAALQKFSEGSDEAKEENLQIQEVTEVDSSPHTRIHGRWLTLARLAWVIGFMALTLMYVFGFFAVRDALSTVCEDDLCSLNRQISHAEAGEEIVSSPGPPIGSADRLRAEQVEALKAFGLTLNQYGWLGALQMGIPALISLLIAAGLFWWKSDNWMALFASAMIATVPLQSMPLVFTLATRTPAWEWVSAPIGIVALSFFIILPLIFPTGQCVPRWTRWVVVYDVIGTVVINVFQKPITENPGVLNLVPIFLLIALGAGIFAQLYRYFRVASPVERQQIKWGIVGLAGFVGIAFTVLLPLNALLISKASVMDPARALILSTIPDTLFHIINLFIPIAIAISVLRYRLWDVDILINRTLVYGALTATVVALYVLLVGWSSIGLQTQNYLPGSVFTILAIAFLFRPLRQRLQRIADRFVPVPQAAPTSEQHKQQIAIPEVQGTTDTTLRGRWLIFARLAWTTGFIALTAMYIFGFIEVRGALSTVCEEEQCTLNQQIRHSEAGDQIMGHLAPPIGYADRLRPDQVEALETLGLTLDQYGRLGALQMGLPLLIYLLVAAGLFWRKSDDWMVLFASIMVATIPSGPVPLAFTLAVRQPTWEWVFNSTLMVSIICLFIFPLIFPNGRFVPPWTRWMVFFHIAFAVIVSLFRSSISENPDAANLVFIYIVIAFATGIYAQLYRYVRVASPLERQQLKWVIVGLAGFVGIAVAVLQPLNALLTSRATGMDPARALILSVIPDTLFQAILLFIPVSIAISVLRYRLWDIDILINRTLVYATLTGIIGSAFIAMVGLLSVLFQSSGNSIIAIIATGLVALLFNPLRQRLQRNVNRLMYGERDEPYIALSRLGRRLETTLAPESVLPTVVTTVREVLRLPYVAIYLQQDSRGYKIVAESASPSVHIENGRIRVPGIEREGRCIPLVHQGETIGYIVLGPRAPNEAFSTTDLRLLQDLAPQVGVAVHAVRLTADLQRSREQLVLAREEERRRLRRDLHDGLGPQLAGLALKLETLRNRLKDDPLADSLLADLAKRTQDATADIRHLVYELRPPTLDELGLVSALREGASQYSQQGHNGLHITIDAPESLPPLAAAVEVAIYRIAQEALTNVIRHADAHNCHIRLSLDESAGLLCLEVQDDGKGLQKKRRAGVGLNSMRERAEELGGSCLIRSSPDKGTCVQARLPVGEFNRSVASLDR